VATGIGATIGLLGLLICGFFVYLYGLSGIAEAREQSVLYKTFAGQLNEATAPVGPTPDTSGTGSNGSSAVQYITEGAPVALLDIKQVGISGLVVVEGTTSGDLMRGPGHVRSSALPGQSGVSVVYGRVATFGAPFAHLMRLNRGDIITVTTGQGISTYKVASFGTKDNPPPDPTANRLILVTGNSSLLSDRAVMVSADLVGAPKQNPGGWPAITPQESYLAGNPGALLPLMLWSQALLLIAVGGVVAANRWSRWPAFLCAVPAAVAVTWAVYENVAALLPNLN
jgi:sortase A